MDSFRKRLALVLVGLATLFSGSSTEADEAPVIPPVIATTDLSTERFSSELDSTGFVEIIEVDDAWARSESAADILNRAVGVHVRKSGGADDHATITVRGASGGQVRVLLDGIHLNRAANDTVNLADIPMHAVERIEIYRGFIPTRFAGSGAQSVINIVTRRTKADQPATFSTGLTYGSYSTGRLSLLGSTALGRTTFHGSLAAAASDGDFELHDDGGTPLDPRDDLTRRRKNNEHESIDALLEFEVPGRGVDLRFREQFLYKTDGTPGLGGTEESLRTKLRTLRSISSIEAVFKNGAALSADATLIEEKVDDPFTLGPDGGDTSIFPYPGSLNTTLATTLGLRHAWGIGAYQLVEFSSEASFERNELRLTTSQASGGRQNQERIRLSLAASDEIFVPKLRLTLSPQIRIESLWNEFSGRTGATHLPRTQIDSANPKLGLRWSATDQVSLKANMGSFFRAPNFGELFGATGFSAANSDLVPEEGINRDIGLSWSQIGLGRASIDLNYAYFNNDLEDQIVFISSGARIPRPQNLGKSRIRGHELAATLATPFGLGATANYTHQKAEIRSPFRDSLGKDIPSIPGDELNLSLTFNRKGWRAEYDCYYRGRVALDTSNTDVSASVVTHSLAIEAPLDPKPIRGLSLRFEAKNLTDRLYFDVQNFPRAGRAFYVTLKYSDPDVAR